MDGLALFRPFICSSWKNVWGDGRRDQRKACSKYRPLLQNPGSEGVCLKHKSTWKILADSKRDHLTRQAHCRALSPLFPSNPLYSRVCSGRWDTRQLFMLDINSAQFWVMWSLLHRHIVQSLACLRQNLRYATHLYEFLCPSSWMCINAKFVCLVLSWGIIPFDTCFEQEES